MYRTVEKNSTSPKKINNLSVTSLLLYLFRRFLLVWITPDKPLYSSCVSLTWEEDCAEKNLQQKKTLMNCAVNTKKMGTVSASEKLWAYPSPNPTTVNWWQVGVNVGSGEVSVQLLRYWHWSWNCFGVWLN